MAYCAAPISSIVIYFMVHVEMVFYNFHLVECDIPVFHNYSSNAYVVESVGLDLPFRWDYVLLPYLSVSMQLNAFKLVCMHAHR